MVIGILVLGLLAHLTKKCLERASEKKARESAVQKGDASDASAGD